MLIADLVDIEGVSHELVEHHRGRIVGWLFQNLFTYTTWFLDFQGMHIGTLFLENLHRLRVRFVILFIGFSSAIFILLRSTDNNVSVFK